MALTYSAWTLPWSGDFHQKVADIPVTSKTGRGQRRLYSTGGTGSVEIDLTDFPISKIISDTEGSLIRVEDDGALIHEWLAERTPQKILDTENKARISGNNLQSRFDKYVVHPDDYPNVDPAPDHYWDGPETLTDGGMEEAATLHEIIEIDLGGASSGTFILNHDGDSTSSIQWDDTTQTVETRIQTDLSGITDVVVDLTAVGYRIEVVVPSLLDPNMSWTPSLNGSDESIDTTREGSLQVPAAWTRSQRADASSDPKEHGTYASVGGFLLVGPALPTNGPVRSGNSSLRVNGLTQYAGAQQIVLVEPGETYQGSIWVRTGDATERFKFVIRDIFGEWIAQDESQIAAANTYEEYTVTFTVPNDRDQIIFRMAQVVDHNPDPFYLDDASLTLGEPAASPGTIMTTLMDDAAVDHSGDARGTPLDWVDYSSWDADDDSNGNPWTSTALSFVAYFGEKYGQILDKFVDLGYEWDLVPKAGPITPGDPTHDLNLYNSGGRDSSPDAIVNIGQATDGGEVVQRIPDYTRVIVADSEGNYIEDEDATAVADFGASERYERFSGEANATALVARGDEMLAAEASNRTAAKVTMTPIGTDFRPLVDYEPGDTVPFQLPPTLPKTDKRIVRIDYLDGEPPEYTVVGSRVFGESAAAFELVRRLWRRFLAPDRELRGGVAPTQGLGGGGAPTVVVAASDASDRSKKKADFQCSGINDQDIINLALAELPLGSTVGGMLVLTEGTFFLNGPIDVSRKNVYIQGRGHDVTTLDFSAANAVEFTGDTANFTISDLTYDGNSGSVFALFQTDNGNIADFAAFRCNFLQCGSGAILLAGTTNEGTSRAIVYHNEFKECGGTNGQVEIGGSTSNGAVVVAMNSFYDGTERPIFGGASVDGTASLNSFVDNTGTTPNVSGLAEVHNHASSSVGETYDADDQHTAFASPLTTKGDVFTYDTVDARLSVGANDQVLTADSAETLGIKWADATGGGGGGGGGSALIVGFGEDDLAASLTDSQLYRNVQGVATQIPVVMSQEGSIIGISVAASATRSAGTATFEVFKNGTGTGLTTVLDGTDTQYASSAQAPSLDTFAAGDLLDIRVTTDGSWAPTTLEVEAFITISNGAIAKSYITLPFLKPPDSADTDDIEFADFANGTDPTAAPGMSWGNQSGNSVDIRGGLLRISALESSATLVGLFIAAPTGDFTVHTAHKFNWLSDGGSGAADTRGGVMLLWGTLATPTAIIGLQSGNLNGQGGFAFQRWSSYTAVATTHQTGALGTGMYEHTRLAWDSGATSVAPTFGQDPFGLSLRPTAPVTDTSQSGDPDFVGWVGLFTNSDSADVSIPFLRFNWTPDFDPTTDN